MNAHRWDAVAFDIDGTLYPNSRFYRRIALGAIAHNALLREFRLARNAMRRDNFNGDFYAEQANRIAKALNSNPTTTRQQLQQFIYNAWQNAFKNIRPFPDVRFTIAALRTAGIKTAVLSDFPINGKLTTLGLDGLWDASLCSEEMGVLKPSKKAFERLQSALDCPASRILYVGNSKRFDVAGAKNAGMGAALLCRFPILTQRGGADYAFRTYRQLLAFVLQ
jgi:putative hydrolase of the HAD superfamily